MTKDIRTEIMNKIEKQEIKPLPKIYFIFTHIFLIGSVIATLLLTSSLISMILFRLETSKPMDLQHLRWLTHIPWVYAIVAAGLLMASVKLAQHTGNLYKLGFAKMLSLLFIGALITGIILKECPHTRKLLNRGQGQRKQSEHIEGTVKGARHIRSQNTQ